MTATSGTVTIVFTDMVGSTALLTEIGRDAAVRLRHEHEAMLRRAVDDHGGEVVDTNGDGVMAVFTTSSHAVEASLAMHRHVATYGRRADAVANFQIRIGVAVGEVSVDHGAYVGEAVVEAARLEALADPGGVLVTDLVKLMADRGSAAVFEGVGELRLKGLPQPVFAHRVFDAEAGTNLVDLPGELDVDSSFPLVGRDDALAAFEATWQQSSAGESRLLFIAGEPGIGKSRLVAEAATRFHGEGAVALYGSCDAELAVPYRPFAQALQQAHTLDDELAWTLSEQTGLLAPLFPVWGAALPDDLSETDRLGLFEAVAKLLDRLANLAPTVVVLDDLHWATRSTVQLLRHLLRYASDGRLLIVGTYRAEEIGRRHPLHELLAEARSDARTTSLTLTGLDEADVVSLLESRTGGVLGDEALAFAERVHAETRGSPFFAAELLRHMATSGALVESDGVWSLARGLDSLPIPESVRDVVGQRVNRLGDDAIDVLSAAAVVGFSFDLDLLASITDRSFDDVLELVEQAERSTLVREGDGPARFVFSHAIVRSTLLDDLSATRRARAHQRIAESLEGLPGNRIDELAHHWLAAVTPTDPSKAIHYLRLAAERDVGALAWEAAVERYRRVIDLLDGQAASDSGVSAEVWLALGEALRATGDLGYREVMEEAGRRARRVDRADLLARAAVGCLKPGVWYVNAGDTDKIMIGMCEGALDELPHDHPLRVRVLSTLATVLAFDPDRDRRVALVEEAETLARRLGDPALLSAALIAEYLALWDPSTLDRRLIVAEELMALALRTGDPEVEFLGGFFRASCLLEGVQLSSTRDQLALLAQPVQATRNFWFEFLVDRVTNAIAIATDQPDTGREVDALFERSGDTQADAPGTWAAQHAAIARHEGRFGDMAAALEGAVQRASEQGIWSYALALAQLDDGQVAEAEATADGLNPEPVLDFFWLVSMSMFAEVGYRLQRSEICKRAVDALLPYRGRLAVVASGTVLWGLTSNALGMAALGAGDVDLARSALTEAIEQAEAMGSEFFAQQSRDLLAKI